MIDEDLKYNKQENVKEVFFTILFIISVIGLVTLNMNRHIFKNQQTSETSTNNDLISGLSKIQEDDHTLFLLADPILVNESFENTFFNMRFSIGSNAGNILK